LTAQQETIALRTVAECFGIADDRALEMIESGELDGVWTADGLAVSRASFVTLYRARIGAFQKEI